MSLRSALSTAAIRAYLSTLSRFGTLLTSFHLQLAVTVPCRIARFRKLRQDLTQPAVVDFFQFALRSRSAPDFVFAVRHSLHRPSDSIFAPHHLQYAPTGLAETRLHTEHLAWLDVSGSSSRQISIHSPRFAFCSFSTVARRSSSPYRTNNAAKSSRLYLWNISINQLRQSSFSRMMASAINLSQHNLTSLSGLS